MESHRHFRGGVIFFAGWHASYPGLFWWEWLDFLQEVVVRNPFFRVDMGGFLMHDH